MNAPANSPPARAALPGTDPVVDARFMLAHPDMAHSPLHTREIVTGLLDQREELLATLTQARKFTFSVAPDGGLLERIDSTIAKVTKGGAL